MGLPLGATGVWCRTVSLRHDAGSSLFQRHRLEFRFEFGQQIRLPLLQVAGDRRVAQQFSQVTAGQDQVQHIQSARFTDQQLTKPGPAETTSLVSNQCGARRYEIALHSQSKCHFVT